MVRYGLVIADFPLMTDDSCSTSELGSVGLRLVLGRVSVYFCVCSVRCFKLVASTCLENSFPKCRVN